MFKEINCKIGEHIPTELGNMCECGYFKKSDYSIEYIKHIRDTVSNFANFKKDVLQIVLEDVPPIAQKRVLKILDISIKSNWQYKPLEKEKIYADLLKIADDGEYEDMRREIIRYFSKNKC